MHEAGAERAQVPVKVSRRCMALSGIRLDRPDRTTAGQVAAARPASHSHGSSALCAGGRVRVTEALGLASHMRYGIRIPRTGRNERQGHLP